jgi:phospho-N-acetylmuramoyl-pentapeptide-transferase
MSNLEASVAASQDNFVSIGFALILASISFLMVVFWGWPYITLLKRWGIGKRIRIDGPGEHFTKMGTPTMGGVLITVPVLLITLALNVYNLLGRTVIGRSILIPLGVMIAYGILGALDDISGVRGVRRGEGFTARFKMRIEIVFTFLLALVLYYGLDLHSIAIPGVPEKIDIGLFYIPIAMFVIISSANATNLTDGLDGLAGIILASAFAAYGVIAHLQQQYYLERFCFTVVGASFAFLWYNAHPAELFMGDTGSLALGATLGIVALMTGQWLILPVVMLVPVAETLAVIIQVGYFKYTKNKYGEGRRFFKMAPLHHHFELLGWSETQVVQRFWLVGLLAAMAGVALSFI